MKIRAGGGSFRAAGWSFRATGCSPLLFLFMGNTINCNIDRRGIVLYWWKLWYWSIVVVLWSMRRKIIIKHV